MFDHYDLQNETSESTPPDRPHYHLPLMTNHHRVGGSKGRDLVPLLNTPRLLVLPSSRHRGLCVYLSTVDFKCPYESKKVSEIEKGGYCYCVQFYIFS